MRMLFMFTAHNSLSQPLPAGRTREVTAFVPSIGASGEGKVQRAWPWATSAIAGWRTSWPAAIRPPLPAERVAYGARLAGQAALLSLIYLASSAIVDFVPIPVPSNLLALLMLLLFLLTGMLRLSHVEELGTFLLRHLTFFFVPFMVGLLALGPLLARAGVALLANLIVATGVGVVVAGLAAQAVVRAIGASHADNR